MSNSNHLPRHSNYRTPMVGNHFYNDIRVTPLKKGETSDSSPSKPKGNTTAAISACNDDKQEKTEADGIITYNGRSVTFAKNVMVATYTRDRNLYQDQNPNAVTISWTELTSITRTVKKHRKRSCKRKMMNWELAEELRKLTNELKRIDLLLSCQISKQFKQYGDQPNTDEGYDSQQDEFDSD